MYTPLPRLKSKVRATRYKTPPILSMGQHAYTGSRGGPSVLGGRKGFMVSINPTLNPKHESQEHKLQMTPLHSASIGLRVLVIEDCHGLQFGDTSLRRHPWPIPRALNTP